MVFQNALGRRLWLLSIRALFQNILDDCVYKEIARINDIVDIVNDGVVEMIKQKKYRLLRKILIYSCVKYYQAQGIMI